MYDSPPQYNKCWGAYPYDPAHIYGLAIHPKVVIPHQEH